MKSLSHAPMEYVDSFDLAEKKIFNIKSKKYLAFILKTQLHLLKKVAKNPNEFYIFFEKKMEKNGKIKIRYIESTNLILKPIHKKILHLLTELSPPDYLFSKKNSSCVLNAKAHADCSGLTLNIDLENFFPSTTRNQVQRFFGYFLQYPIDVAIFMSKICTVNDHIPTGSPLSLLLAFWANKPMFDELNRFSKSRNIKMTIYVDDISFTGVAVNNLFKDKIIEIVEKYNHNINNDKIRFFKEDLKFINGIAIVHNEIKPNNKISKDIRQLREIKNNDDTNKLNGKLNFINYIKNISKKI